MTSQDVLEGAGIGVAELSGGSLAVRSPIDGAEIARIAETPLSDMPAIIARARLSGLAPRPGAPPRRARAPAWRGAPRFQARSRGGCDAGSGQNRLGEPRRSAGDDRRL